MKKLSLLALVTLVSLSCSQPGNAADGKVAAGAKKVGQAVMWGPKMVWQSVKWGGSKLGSGVKKITGK